MDIPLYFPKQSKVGYCRKLTHDPIAEAQAKGKTENLPKFRAEYIFRGGNWHRQQKRILGFAVFFTLRKNRETQTRARAASEGKEKTVCSRTDPRDLLFTCSCEDPILLLLLPVLGSALFGVFFHSRKRTRSRVNSNFARWFFPHDKKVPLFFAILGTLFEKLEFFALTIPILRSFREVFVGWSKVEKGSRLTWLWFV